MRGPAMGDDSVTVGEASGGTAQPHIDAHTVARSTRQTAVAQGLTQVLRLASSIVLARLLTPSDFGVVAVALVVASILDQVKDVGTGSAVIQRHEVDQVLLNSVFFLNAVMGTLACAILVVLAEPLASALGNPTAAPVVRAFGVITLVTSFGHIHQSLLKRSMRFGAVSVIAIISATVSVVVSITAALLGLNYWALVVGSAASALVGTVALWVLDPWRPTAHASMAGLRSIWAFSWNLFLSNILFFTWSQTDKVIVSRFAGASGLGTYTMAQRFVTTPLAALSTVIGEVTFPAFSRRQDDNAALRAGFTRSSSVIALVTFPMMLGAAVIAAPMVDVLLGPKWNALVPVLWVLAPAGAIQSITLNCNQLLLAKGRSDWSFRWGVVFFIVLTSLELVFVRWGAVGVATGYAVGTVALTPFTLLLVFRTVDASLRDYARALLPYIWILR